MEKKCQWCYNWNDHYCSQPAAVIYSGAMLEVMGQTQQLPLCKEHMDMVYSLQEIVLRAMVRNAKEAGDADAFKLRLREER